MPTAPLAPEQDRAPTRTTGPAAAAGVFDVSAVMVSQHVGWLAAGGRLVGDTAAARLAGALKRQHAIGCRFARLDLSRVSMLDRAGFDVLVEAHQRFLATGGTLVLTGVGPRIARLLELTGLDGTLFTVARATDPPPPPASRRGSRRGGAPAGDRSGEGSADRGREAAAAHALEARSTIDRAVGVVMGRTRCGVAEATERLLVLSQATNRTLREVAQSILDESVRTARPPERSNRGERTD